MTSSTGIFISANGCGVWASSMVPAASSAPVRALSILQKKPMAFSADMTPAAIFDAQSEALGKISRSMGTAITWSGCACVTTIAATEAASRARLSTCCATTGPMGPMPPSNSTDFPSPLTR